VSGHDLAGSGSYLLGPAVRVSLVRDGDGTLPLEASGPALLDSPGRAARELLARIPDDGREHFGVTMLTVRRAPTAHLEVSVGCLTATVVHPREVYGPALVAAAAAVIIWHCHPRGDPEPSSEDLALTRRLAAAGQTLGIELLDHIIVAHGTGRWVSLKERGVL